MIRDQVRERIEELRESTDANTSDHDPDLERVVLDEARDRLKRFMEEKRLSATPAMNRAEFDATSRTIAITKFAGKLIRNMGRTVCGKRMLNPEEALFLMEAAALELFHNGIPLSLSQAYSLLITDDLSWDQYSVYSHLTRAGYVVVRYVESPSNQANPTTRRLSIAYDVHLASSGYSVSKIQIPNHRVVIMRPDEEAITVDEVITLRSRTNDEVPFHVAIVDHGDVLYFKIDWIAMPDLNDRSDHHVQQ